MPASPAATSAARASGATRTGTVSHRQARTERQPALLPLPPLPEPRGRANALAWLRLILLLGLSLPSIGMPPPGPAGAAALRQATRSTPLAFGFQGDFFET